MVCAREGPETMSNLSASPPGADKRHGRYLKLRSVWRDRDLLYLIPALLGRMPRYFEIGHWHYDAMRLPFLLLLL